MVAGPKELELEEEDQRVVLGGSWRDFKKLLAIRGEGAGVRLYFLDGEIELVSPAWTHELRKTLLARLLELWAVETDVELEGIGSWTLKKKKLEAAAEPDECYFVGEVGKKKVPDLVIEIEWSRTMGLAKKDIYKRLGVRELWTMRSDRRLVICARVEGQWVEQAGSTLLPQLDVEWLLSFLDIGSQSKSLRALRDALRARERGG